ncbi:hypothetical protein LMIY3S_03504 [Labrys miyagiensis]
MPRKLASIAIAVFVTVCVMVAASSPAQAGFGIYLGFGFPWIGAGYPYYDPYYGPYYHDNLYYDHPYYYGPYHHYGHDGHVVCRNHRVLVRSHHHRHWVWEHSCHHI